MKKMLIFVLLTGCISAPDSKDFDCKPCFYHAFCLYLNRENPDKSACSALDAACADAIKESTQRERLEFCREFCLDSSMSEQTCLLLVNQR